MLDISFYMKFDKVMTKIKSNGFSSQEEVYWALEEIRSKNPIVYNIETTNRCNMQCAMCPRTTMMTRNLEDIDMGVFLDIVGQIKPHSEELWEKWKAYSLNKYGIAEKDEPSENHFFLYIITKVIQLHGYGDPLLDKNMPRYIRALAEKNIPAYFSCNPANINLTATYEMMEEGLSYIKYSIESVHDEEYKKIRGRAANFSKSYKDILKVLAYKNKHNLPTTIVVTMLNLNRKNQEQEFADLMQAFADMDVYVYLKSEDCQWYRKDYHQTKSIHWTEVCKHPWMTMTIKSNGEAAMCMEDFNNEIILGDVTKESLYSIWNSRAYADFRLRHISGAEGLKCHGQCDMQLLADFCIKEHIVR